MLSNAYFLAKFPFDAAENEPAKNLQNFAKFANFADLELDERLRVAHEGRGAREEGVERPLRLRLVAVLEHVLEPLLLLEGLPNF